MHQKRPFYLLYEANNHTPRGLWWPVVPILLCKYTVFLLAFVTLDQIWDQSVKRPAILQ